MMKSGPLLAVFALAFFSLSIVPVQGAVTLSNSTCTSATISESNVTIGTVSSFGQNVTTVTRSDYCSYGCNYKTGLCEIQTNGFGTSAGLMMGSGILAFVLAFIASRIDKTHFAIQTLFIFLSMISLITSVGIMREVANVENISANMESILDNQVMIVTYGFYIAMAYYVLFFVYEVFKKMSSANKGMRKVRL